MKNCRWLKLAVAFFLAVFVCLPQPTPDPLLASLDRIAQHHLDDRAHAISAIRTPADAERRKAIIRTKLTNLIGGLPTYDGPLNARVTGQLQTGTYTIEKLIFESLPGFYVTGNLYRPNTTGPHPAILVPAGHTQEGKPEVQTVAANLASKGFVRWHTIPSDKASASKRICRNWAGHSQEEAATSILNSAHAAS